MKNFRIAVSSGVILALAGLCTVVVADTSGANCKLYHKGELNEEASGHCKFSQRQGYVDIRLRNGKTFNLSPGNKANHFKDQKGHTVVRSNEGNGAHRYKWEHKRVIVSFNNKGENAGSSSVKFGETPRNLRDLIGQRGGEAEDKLINRGYKLRNSSRSGSNVYSNWKEPGTGACVALHSDANSGLYKSIVYTMDFDCQHKQ